MKRPGFQRESLESIRKLTTKGFRLSLVPERLPVRQTGLSSPGVAVLRSTESPRSSPPLCFAKRSSGDTGPARGCGRPVPDSAEIPWIIFGRLLVFFLVVWSLCLNPCAHAETVKDFYEQGQQAYDQGDYQKAVDLFEKTIELDPNFAQAYNALGLAHREIDADLSEMAWLFKTATEVDPNYAQAYDNLGKAYYGLGDFDKAEQSCLKALSLAPHLASAKLSLGWIYLLGKSSPKEAIHYFKEVLKQNKIPYAYFGLGMAYYMSGNRTNVLEMITALRSMEREDLASQLENMVRGGSYSGQEEGTPLVNTQPKSLPQDESTGQSTLVPSSPAAVSQEGKNTAGSIMRVRLRGKMFSIPSAEPAGKVSTPSSTSSLGVIENSSSSIERIKKLRFQTIPKSY